MSIRVKTCTWTLVDRHLPPQTVGPIAQQLEASGVVDLILCPDQMTGFMPRAVWTPENTPLANVMKDCDSFSDPVVLGTLALAATTKLGLALTADVVRRGPSELMQTMLTLANAAQGREVLFCFGSGELKQLKPFGYKRLGAVDRMEDQFRLFRMLLDQPDELIDFEGNSIKWTQGFMGSARPFRPKFHAMGGGPKLFSNAVKYADGLISFAPGNTWSPDMWAKTVQNIRQEVTQAGRDPEQFETGFMCITLLHEDPDVIERAIHNPLVKMMAAIFGRLHHGDWAKEGIPLAFPENWHYAVKGLFHTMSKSDVDAVVSKVTPEMVRKSFYIGTPKEVAAELGDYVEAGLQWVAPLDVLNMTLTPETDQPPLSRVIELCSHLKAL